VFFDICIPGMEVIEVVRLMLKVNREVKPLTDWKYSVDRDARRHEGREDLARCCKAIDAMRGSRTTLPQGLLRKECVYYVTDN